MVENPKPLMSWDDDLDATTEDLVWWSKLDDRFQVEVRRVHPYTGDLFIFDHEDEDKMVYHDDVTLSYDALFGPDVSDVAYWEEAAETAVDTYLHTNKGA